MENGELIALAAQLGVSVEFLWKTLVNAALLHTATNFTLILLVCVCSFIGFKYVSKIEDEFNRSFGQFVTFIFGLMGALSLVPATSKLLLAMFNPEYWALREILSII